MGCGVPDKAEDMGGVRVFQPDMPEEECSAQKKILKVLTSLPLMKRNNRTVMKVYVKNIFQILCIRLPYLVLKRAEDRNLTG